MPQLISKSVVICIISAILFHVSGNESMAGKLHGSLLDVEWILIFYDNCIFPYDGNVWKVHADSDNNTNNYVLRDCIFCVQCNNSIALNTQS